jgi:lysozyme
MVDQALNNGVNGNLGVQGPNGGAEGVVKKYVTRFQLTQDQFDALVSFVYNRGETNSRRILVYINQHDFAQATQAMSEVVYAKNRNGQEVIQPGLVARRQYETAPFR